MFILCSCPTHMATHVKEKQQTTCLALQEKNATDVYEREVELILVPFCRLFKNEYVDNTIQQQVGRRRNSSGSQVERPYASTEGKRAPFPLARELSWIEVTPLSPKVSSVASKKGPAYQRGQSWMGRSLSPAALSRPRVPRAEFRDALRDLLRGDGAWASPSGAVRCVRVCSVCLRPRRRRRLGRVFPASLRSRSCSEGSRRGLSLYKVLRRCPPSGPVQRQPRGAAAA